MIGTNQPECFSEEIIVRVSCKGDGTMLDKAAGTHQPAVVANRRKFCEAVGIHYDDVVYQRVAYSDDQTYDKIAIVDASHTSSSIDEVAADALITTDSGVGLFLPVADCVGTVLYDQPTRQLAIAHLGRHSTIAGLMTKTLAHMQQHGASAEDILIWMAPSVQKESYKMEYFTQANDPQWQDFMLSTAEGIHLNLQGYNRARALEAGVRDEHIVISPVDTAIDEHYFSHSQGDTAGRFAVIAYLT